MGSVYFNKKSKRWRVQIVHRGFNSISMYFDTKEEAQIWHHKIDKIMRKKIKKGKENRLLKKLKENL